MNCIPALYLLPTNISEAPFADFFPAGNLTIISEIRHFIVENVRTARRFIKRCVPDADISSLTFYELNGHTDERMITSYLDPLRKGEPIGVMSEAGCPGIADPGASVVRIAQEENLKVIPLAGPSSILMGLMASGMNGQRFAFNGYLPVDGKEREKKIREYESLSSRMDMTQIFIETPYRNRQLMEALLKTLHPETLLCVAISVTDPEKESILTKTVSKWKSIRTELPKEPALFLIYSDSSNRRH